MFAKTSIEALKRMRAKPLFTYLHGMNMRSWPVWDRTWLPLNRVRFRRVTELARECYGAYEKIEGMMGHLRTFRPAGDVDENLADFFGSGNPLVIHHTTGFGIAVRRAEAAVNHLYLIQQLCRALDNIWPQPGNAEEMSKGQPLDDFELVIKAAMGDIEKTHRALLDIQQSVQHQAYKLKADWQLVCCEEDDTKRRTCWASKSDLWRLLATPQIP